MSKIGDRVLITSPDHPWDGYSGEIIAPFSAAGLDWEVALDDWQYGVYSGQRAAVADREVRVERRKRPRA